MCSIRRGRDGRTWGKLLVELLEQVARFGRINAEGRRIELVQRPRHGADCVCTLLVPSVQIPGKEIAFEKVVDTELRPDATLLKRA